MDVIIIYGIMAGLFLVVAGSVTLLKRTFKPTPRNERKGN